MYVSSFSLVKLIIIIDYIVGIVVLILINYIYYYEYNSKIKYCNIIIDRYLFKN